MVLVPARKGSWADLSPRTRDRWRARYGGRGDLVMRTRRAEAAYDVGATISRAQAGHEAPPGRPNITALVQRPDGSVGHVEIAGLSRRTRSRIGRYDALLRQLTEGRISERAFRRRVLRWVPVAGGIPLASTPRAALVAEEERRASGEELGPYPDRGSGS